MSRKKTLFISLGVLVVGAAITTLIFSTEPTAKRSGATRETAMLAEVTEVKRATYHPTIQVMGTVKPSRDIILSPRVSGKIIHRSPSFTPGGFVEKGDTLLRINPADYRNELQQRKSELQKALSDLRIEQGRQEMARQEYQLIGDTLTGMNKALVLREPQLQSARSSVTSARAAVDQARLNLSRTTITAPFDAHIVTRNVNVGSQVAPGDNLGRLVGRDSYWVEATVPLSKLRWLTFPDSVHRKGAVVRIKNRTAWKEGEYRKGFLYKMVGQLEEKTRMARVLIRVPDPLAHKAEHHDKPAMMIGSFVEASIQTKKLRDVIRINRDFVRENETVWVMKADTLNIKKVDISFEGEKYAYITDGLRDEDKVVTTNLATVEEGARLRLKSASTSAPDSGTGKSGR